MEGKFMRGREEGKRGEEGRKERGERKRGREDGRKGKEKNGREVHDGPLLKKKKVNYKGLVLKL